MTVELEREFCGRVLGTLGNHQDMREHLEILSKVASDCLTVVEFGVRTGNSTVALLHGLERGTRNGKRVLHSYDIADPAFNPPKLECVEWIFHKADTSALAEIPWCDLLLIDTKHTCVQVTAELKHERRVIDRIVFHDTVAWGDKGEGGELGITSAIYAFLAEHGDDWRVDFHRPNCNGLLCLRRISDL